MDTIFTANVSRIDNLSMRHFIHQTITSDAYSTHHDRLINKALTLVK
ncbi:hypothetical protein [Vibrio nomapromontoriensis]